MFCSCLVPNIITIVGVLLNEKSAQEALYSDTFGPLPVAVYSPFISINFCSLYCKHFNCIITTQLTEQMLTGDGIKIFNRVIFK